MRNTMSSVLCWSTVKTMISDFGANKDSGSKITDTPPLFVFDMCHGNSQNNPYGFTFIQDINYELL